jgi:hypothetical protein
VAHDVEEGREHLNFSEWDQLNTEEQVEAMEEAWEEVEEGEMQSPSRAPSPQTVLGDGALRVPR